MSKARQYDSWRRRVSGFLAIEDGPPPPLISAVHALIDELYDADMPIYDITRNHDNSISVTTNGGRILGLYNGRILVTTQQTTTIPFEYGTTLRRQLLAAIELLKQGDIYVHPKGQSSW